MSRLRSSIRVAATVFQLSVWNTDGLDAAETELSCP
jgi:hypothetical protein